MNIPDSRKYVIPSTPISFRLSRASLSFIVATVLLAALTGFSTYKNIRREQTLMETGVQSVGPALFPANFPS